MTEEQSTNLDTFFEITKTDVNKMIESMIDKKRKPY